MAYEKLKQRWIEKKNERSRLSLDRKQKLINLSKDLFQSYGIRTVYLFGSTAVQQASQSSDIDLYVSPLLNNDYWKFHFELEELLELPVDLYTDEDDPMLVKKIIERGEKIYEV